MALSLSGDDEEYDSETEQVSAFTFSQLVCVLICLLYERKLFFLLAERVFFLHCFRLATGFYPLFSVTLSSRGGKKKKNKNTCVIQSLCCVNSHTGCRDEYTAKRIVH